MAKTARSLRCPRSASTPFWLQATLRSRFYSPTTNLVEAQAGKPNIPASSQGRHRSARCSPKAPPPLPPGCGWGKRPLSVSCRMTAYAYAELFTSAAPTPSGNHPAPEAAAGAPAAREAPAKGSRLWLDAVPGRAGGSSPGWARALPAAGAAPAPARGQRPPPTRGTSPGAARPHGSRAQGRVCAYGGAKGGTGTGPGTCCAAGPRVAGRTPCGAGGDGSGSSSYSPGGFTAAGVAILSLSRTETNAGGEEGCSEQRGGGGAQGKAAGGPGRAGGRGLLPPRARRRRRRRWRSPLRAGRPKMSGGPRAASAHAPRAVSMCRAPAHVRWARGRRRPGGTPLPATPLRSRSRSRKGRAEPIAEQPSRQSPPPPPRGSNRRCPGQDADSPAGAGEVSGARSGCRGAARARPRHWGEAVAALPAAPTRRDAGTAGCGLPAAGAGGEWPRSCPAPPELMALPARGRRGTPRSVSPAGGEGCPLRGGRRTEPPRPHSSSAQGAGCCSCLPGKRGGGTGTAGSRVTWALRALGGERSRGVTCTDTLTVSLAVREEGLGASSG